MTDSLFQTAAKASIPAFLAVFGVPVTYARGAQSVPVTAIPPDSDTQVVTAEGVRARTSGGEFQILKASLVLGGSAIEPARGDTITWGSKVYDVRDWESLEDSAQWRLSVQEVG